LVLVAGSVGKSVTTKLLASIFTTAGASVGTWTHATSEINGVSLEHPPTMPTDRKWQEWVAACDTDGATIVAVDPSQTQLLESLNPPATVACLTHLRTDGLSTDSTRRWKSTQEHRKAIGRTLDRIDSNTPLAVNADDAESLAFASHHTGPLLTFGEQPHADIFAMPLDSFPGGQEFLVTVGRDTAAVSVGTPGTAFRSNCLAAIATGIAAGFDLTTCVRGIERAAAPQGMLEPVVCGQPFPVVLDRATRPLALRAAIVAARPAGGGRSYVAIRLSNNAPIANEQIAVAAKMADRVFATGDAQLIETVPSNVTIVEDRVAAIAVAVGLADEGDAVLIAGCKRDNSTDRKITEQLLRRRLESDTTLSDAA
jgi:UDP-N-acetylmuramoyl-L-alanyl-D-glutamate--2,6-diaminopimelate ligase